MQGRNHSDSSREKMSASAKKWHAENENPMSGKHQSDEVKSRLSEKAKLRVGEKNSFYGKHHTEATKKRLSEYRKGKPNVSCSKRVSVEGVTYPSLTQAGRELGILVPTLCYRVNSESDKWCEYFYLES